MRGSKDMRTLLLALMLALAAAPLAAAQETAEKNETVDRPDDAAWVDDCPPDMMCAAGEPHPYGNESCIECSGPVDDGPTYGDCGGEVCAYDAGDTCMDGAGESETCRDDVQYLDGGSRGPSDGSCEFCRGEDNVVTAPEGAEGGITSVQDKGTQTANVPAPTLLLVLAGIVGIALLALPRRR